MDFAFTNKHVDHIWLRVACEPEQFRHTLSWFISRKNFKAIKSKLKQNRLSDVHSFHFIWFVCRSVGRSVVHCTVQLYSLWLMLLLLFLFWIHIKIMRVFWELLVNILFLLQFTCIQTHSFYGWHIQFEFWKSFSFFRFICPSINNCAVSISIRLLIIEITLAISTKS